MTRPWRRITLHLSQMALTLGLTFIGRSPSGWLWVSLVAVDDATTGQVVRRELHHHAVLGEDPDVVLAHLAADVGENLVPVAQLHAEHRVGEGLHDGALDLDHAFFLRHVLHNPLSVVYRRPANLPAGAAGWVDLMRPSVAPRSPGTRVTVTLNDVAGVPGSREAPRDGPMLGRLFSLVRGGSETESSSGQPASSRRVCSRAGLRAGSVPSWAAA